MQIAFLGIDLGKDHCSLVGLDDRGAVVKLRRMRPAGVVGLAKTLRPCIIAMELAAAPTISAVFLRHNRG